LEDYFRLSGVLEVSRLDHTPFLAFVSDGEGIKVQIVHSASALRRLPPETKVMGQWTGKWRSDFFQFTVGDLPALTART